MAYQGEEKITKRRNGERGIQRLSLSKDPYMVVSVAFIGYLIDLAIAFFYASPSLTPEWRLLVITIFCGGLTTFSTFSSEVVSLLQRGRLGWAVGSIAVHAQGSMLTATAGLATSLLLRYAMSVFFSKIPRQLLPPLASYKFYALTRLTT